MSENSRRIYFHEHFVRGTFYDNRMCADCGKERGSCRYTKEIGNDKILPANTGDFEYFCPACHDERYENYIRGEEARHLYFHIMQLELFHQPNESRVHVSTEGHPTLTLLRSA